METPDGRGAINYAIRVPRRVIAVVCPWDLPLLLMTWNGAGACLRQYGGGEAVSGNADGGDTAWRSYERSRGRIRRRTKGGELSLLLNRPLIRIS
jgi:hypothetical protein